MKLIDTLRQISPRAALQLACSHALLIAGCLYGELPYVAMQTLLAAELWLLSLATIPLYPERGVLRHVFDMLKLSGALVFVLFFLVATYGVAGNIKGEGPLLLAAHQLQELDRGNVGWALAYIVISLAVAMVQALRSGDARLTWAKTVLHTGGATFLAMFFMVFVAVFIGRHLILGLSMVGIDASVDVVLSILMVLLRYAMALIASTMTESEVAEIARQPYHG